MQPLFGPVLGHDHCFVDWPLDWLLYCQLDLCSPPTIVKVVFHRSSLDSLVEMWIELFQSVALRLEIDVASEQVRAISLDFQLGSFVANRWLLVTGHE